MLCPHSVRGIRFSRRAIGSIPLLFVFAGGTQLAVTQVVAFHAARAVAFWVALCALLAMVLGELAGSGAGRGADRGRASRSALSVGLGSIALFLGVAAALVVTLFLVLRLLQIGVEIVQAVPTRWMASVTFSPLDGWTAVVLFAACGLRALCGRDGRVIIAVFWLAVLGVGWLCTSASALETNSTGGFERGAVPVWLLAGLTVVLVVTVALGGIVERGRRWRLVHEDPDSLADLRCWAPGLSMSVAAVSLCVGLLVLFHLLVPIRLSGSYRLTLLVVMCCAIAAAVSCFVLCGRRWSGGLADAGFGLATLAVALCISLFVPSHNVALADRYPQLFNAMLVGFAVATAWWTWLSQVWHQQLDDGNAWTTAGRMIPFAKRFAFFSAALGFLCGVMMAFWPRVPGIATMDHSYGRITAGFSANLFLLLVMLWASRRLRRATFHVLTLLVVVSTGGFLIVRMLPFASDVG